MECDLLTRIDTVLCFLDLAKHCTTVLVVVILRPLLEPCYISAYAIFKESSALYSSVELICEAVTTGSKTRRKDCALYTLSPKHDLQLFSTN